jgi:hypothetical protein
MICGACLIILQERLHAAAELEVSHFQKLNQTDEEYEKNKQLIREGFKIRPTLMGSNGLELFGLAADVFDSPNFPESLRSIYINSSINLKALHGYTVRNYVEIFIDFSRPEIFDFNFLPSGSTPNGSNVRVHGSDATWVNGVFHEVRVFINDRKALAPWLHRHSIYDVLLLVLGYPLGFWACFKAAPFFPTADSVGPFLRAALYVYVFLAVLIGFRTLFHYSRWVFPVVELRHPKSKALQHRFLLGELSLSLVGALLYDGLKALLREMRLDTRPE